MKIEKCFEVLELDPAASREDVKQAYRDLVSIWHPDRFSGNPRLQSRAEARLKELNEAYSILTEPFGGERGGGRRNRFSELSGEDKRDPVEAFAEAGTFMVLNACAFFRRTARSLLGGQDPGTGRKRKVPDREETI